MTLCTRRAGDLNQMKLTYELLALQLDPNRRDGKGTWRMDGGVAARQGRGTEAAGEEGGSEADRTKEERKEGGSQAGLRKEERVDPSNEARHSCRRVPA